MHAIFSGLEVQSSARRSPCLDQRAQYLSIYLSNLRRNPNERYMLWKLSTNTNTCGFVFYFLEVHVLTRLSCHGAFPQVRRPSGREGRLWPRQLWVGENVYQPREDALSLEEWVVPTWNGVKAARYPPHP